MDAQTTPSTYSPIRTTTTSTKSSLPFTELDQILSSSLFAKTNKSTPDRSSNSSRSFTQISPIKKSLNKFSKGLKFLKSIAEKPYNKGADQEKSTETEEPRPRTLSEDLINISSNSSFSQNDNDDSPKFVSEDLRLIVNNKLENLEKALHTITSFEQGIFAKVEEALNDKEQQLLKTLDTRFEEYIRLLSEKKSDISSKISAHFGELREKVREKSYPKESQYEAKTKVIEWKNHVKRKIETWKTAETVEVANDVIEEDETAMAPEIRVWMNRVDNMLNLGNLDALVDKSLLVFDDDFTKKIDALCEFKALLEESLSKQSPVKQEKDSSSKDDSFSVDNNADKIAFIKKFFKVHQLKADLVIKDAHKITLKPNNTLLPTATSKAKKNQQFKFEDFADFPRFEITCEDFKDKHLVKFSEALKSFPTLRELTVQFSQCDNIRDASLEVFGAAIAELSSLQHLHLICDSTSLKSTDETLVKLLSKIADSSSIQGLQLSFSAMIGVTSEGYIQIWKEFLRIPNLARLKVAISDEVQFTDEALGKISESIRQMTALRGLEIRLKGSDKITNKGFAYLTESLAKLIGLEELSIAFIEESGSFNDRSFSGLIQTLSKLTMLKSLTLAFPKCYVSNERFAEFSQVLAKFSLLRALKLDFSWSLLGDESLFELARAVSCLLYLTSLEVDFTACSVSNKGFKELVNATSGLFNLHKLGLDFAWCREITDEGLIAVGETVTKLDNLVKVMINFKEVRKVSEVGVVKFCEMLLKSNGIEELEMDLVNCGRDLNEESRTKIDAVLASGRKQINKKIVITS